MTTVDWCAVLYGAILSEVYSENKSVL